MANGYPKILFFINGATPTPEDLEAADAFGPGVAFRNASLIGPDQPIEDCDGVGGPAVPEAYAEALPDAGDQEAVKKRMANRSPALAAGLGVEPDEPEETDEAKQARIDNALARGGKKGAINERHAEPSTPSTRTSAYGGPRVAPAEEWETAAATLPAGPPPDAPRPEHAAAAEAAEPPAPRRGGRHKAAAEE